MKKFFTLLASAFVVFSAAAETVTFDAPGTWLTAKAGAQSETKEGITISTPQGWAGSYDDGSHYRVYKSQTFTVNYPAGRISKLEFTCTANGDAKYGPGNFTNPTSGTYTFEAEGPAGVWEGDASKITMTASGNQVRFSKLVVTYTEGNPDPEPEPEPEPEPGDKPTLNDVNTCANLIACYDAAVIKDDDIVKVQAYVVSMVLKPTNFAKYGSVCIWLNDSIEGTAKQFELYNCYGTNADTLASFVPVEGEVDMTVSSNIDVQSVTCKDGTVIKVGDNVVATGKIKKYNSTYELNTGCNIVSVNSGASIEGLKSEATSEGKIFQNGKFMIRKNGRTYSVAGF